VTATIDLLDGAGGKAGTLDLPAEIFDAPVNVPLIHQVVVAQLAAARQGTHSTKTRGQVSGGGAKPYRQKGTGRARQGSRRAPQFTGGGVVHGPQPRSYAQRTPKKMKAAALRGALSDRARNGRVHVVTSLVDGDVPSTKSGLAALRTLTERSHVLVVLDRNDTVSWLSLRNLPEVHLLTPDQLNTYDVLTNDDVVFTTRAYAEFTGAEVAVDEAAAKKSAAAGAKKTAKKAAAKKTADDDSEATEKAGAKKTAAKATAKKAAVGSDTDKGDASGAGSDDAGESGTT
jgi:large subunit ribosomal protein L4